MTPYRDSLDPDAIAHQIADRQASTKSTTAKSPSATAAPCTPSAPAAYSGLAVVRPRPRPRHRISDATTGEILRELTLDTTRKYQPQNAKQPEP